MLRSNVFSALGLTGWTVQIYNVHPSLCYIIMSSELRYRGILRTSTKSDGFQNGSSEISVN